MALRFIEGFEVESEITHATRKYATVIGGSWGVSEDGRKRTAARSIRSDILALVTEPLVTSLGNTWTVGFGFKLDLELAASPANFPGIHLMDGGTAGTDDQLAVVIARPSNATASEPGSGVIEVRRGAAVLATGTTRLLEKRWYYIEMTATVRTGINGAYEVKIDGTTEVSDSGIDAANQGTDGADRVRIDWRSDGVDDVSLDDIYVADDGTFLGDVIIEGVEAITGDGDTAQWDLQGGATDVGHALLDQQAVVQSLFEDRRIASNTVGQISLADFGNLTWIRDGTIHGVHVHTLARMETSGTRTLRNRFRDKDGVPGESDGAVDLVLTDTAFDTFLEMFENNPVTAAAWTVAEIDAGQWGVRVTA